MGMESDELQFDISPCPRCGKKIKVSDARQLDPELCGGYAIQHCCGAGEPNELFYCYGENLRAAVQNWNKLMEEADTWGTTRL